MGDDADQPPKGALRVNLMRHQAMALAWCVLLLLSPPEFVCPRVHMCVYVREGDDADEPPEGALRVQLMRHQAMALAWCVWLLLSPPEFVCPRVHMCVYAGVGVDADEPPEGALRVNLRHQAMALAWCVLLLLSEFVCLRVHMCVYAGVVVDADNPPEGALRVKPMRHQAMALAWCGLLSSCPSLSLGVCVSYMCGCSGGGLGCRACVWVCMCVHACMRVSLPLSPSLCVCVCVCVWVCVCVVLCCVVCMCHSCPVCATVFNSHMRALVDCVKVCSVPEYATATYNVMGQRETSGCGEVKSLPVVIALWVYFRMTKRETSGTKPVGGILADDQGLGKTISTIALIVTERPPRDPKASHRSPIDGKPNPTQGKRGPGRPPGAKNKKKVSTRKV